MNTQTPTQYPLHYQITPQNFGTHTFAVTIKVRCQDDIVTATMPKWIPGSYKIRDYARNIYHVTATTADGKNVDYSRVGSATWQFHSGGADFTIQYYVYAFDLSVRGAYLDDTRFFFNHCAVFMDIKPLSEQPRRIDIQPPKNWQIFTTLPEHNGYYSADSYFAQVDFPVECSEQFRTTEFKVAGVVHQMTYTGLLKDDYLLEQMAKDVKKICKAQVKLFGNSPLERYHFLTFLAPGVYGGLEHLDSTALMSSPEMMLTDEKNRHTRYIDFLGLCSHEYFHLWNIKRLRPADFMPYQLDAEQPTQMLWLFEGFTAYYDELMLCRSGVIDAAEFLARLGKTISGVIAQPGRLEQSLAESSYDAWIKLYQADENARNFMVSYYTKGSLFACYLDLWLRLHSNNQHSLDDVMRRLWLDFALHNKGVREADVIAICKELVNGKDDDIDDLFAQYIHGSDDIPLPKILKAFAIKVEISAESILGKTKTSDCGFKLKDNIIQSINSDSTAAKAGLSVKDKLIAINNYPIETIDSDELLYQQLPDSKVNITYSRLGQIYNKEIRLDEPKFKQIKLSIDEATELNASWLADWLDD